MATRAASRNKPGGGPDQGEEERLISYTVVDPDLLPIAIGLTREEVSAYELGCSRCDPFHRTCATCRSLCDKGLLPALRRVKQDLNHEPCPAATRATSRLRRSPRGHTN